MKKSFVTTALILLLFIVSGHLFARRAFVHPGLSYTQGDIDRMKAMIAARQEPFYSTYLQLLAGAYSSPTAGGHEGITQITEGQHNNTIGYDGRRALDCAMLYQLTGSTAYAQNAVRILNGYNSLVNSSSRGTGPLDNGKIYMLLEAAELMRDYSGWAAADLQAFRNMLVYPGYSTKLHMENQYNPDTKTTYATNVDSLNRVTFYWNIYNGDAGRFGNQGLFAMRGMMAMGIFLDNDTIYDRAYRYLLGLPHRADDLAYPAGPRAPASISSETEYMYNYTTTNYTTTADYGYDELLKYYIYRNGQCQESCRDQGHTMGGVGSYACIAEMAWNQGDSLYSCLENRILKGIEWNTRYNLSAFQTYDEQLVPWEATGYTKNEADCTYDNGMFYQAVSRSARWEGKKIYDLDRGSAQFGPGGYRELALAHYAVRAGLDTADYQWLKRSRDLLITDYGFENWGSSGHHYEWLGWGTLTNRRTAWMAGDPVRFISGARVSGMRSAPCVIPAVDYDYYCEAENADGHTYHNAGAVRSSVYRTDGTPEIVQTDSGYCLTDMVNGEWMNYTVNFSTGEVLDTALSLPFNIYATYTASASGGKLFASVDGSQPIGKELAASDTLREKLLGTVTVPCGAAVLRVYVKGISNLLKLYKLRIEPVQVMGNGKLDLSDSNICTVRMVNQNGVDKTDAAIIRKAVDGSYTTNLGLGQQTFMVFDFGAAGIDIKKLLVYNDKTHKDTRECVAVWGDCSTGHFTGAWDYVYGSATNADYTTVMRTNGSAQNSYPVAYNNWSTDYGNYGLASIGKWRYVAPYNWSTTCQIAEIEIYSTPGLVTVAKADTEASAIWDSLDETYLPENKPDALSVQVHGNVVNCVEASSMEAWSLQGIKCCSTRQTSMTLPKGLSIIRVLGKNQTIAVQKIYVY
jgi:hypothetical protein